MAHVLKLINENSETVDFLAGLSSGFLLDNGGLFIGPPNYDDVFMDTISGRELIDRNYQDREIEIRFEMVGVSRDAIVTNIVKLNRMLTHASDYRMFGSGWRTNLHYRIDNAGDNVYFNVLAGVFELPGNLMSVENILQREGTNYVIRGCSLKLITKPIAYSTARTWDETLTSISFSSTPGSGIANNGTPMYFTGAALPDCDYEMPLKFFIQPQQTNTLSKVILGLQSKKKGSAWPYPWIDPYAAVGYSYSDNSDSTCFGGKYWAFSTSITALSLSTHRIQFRPGTTEADNFVGPYRIFVSFRSALNINTITQMRLIMPDYTKFQDGEIITMDNTSTYVVDYGTFFLPPYLQELTNLARWEFHVGFASKSGSIDVDLDAIHMIPQVGGYRVLEGRQGAFTRSTQVMIDDGWLGYTYVVDWSGSAWSSRQELVRPLFRPIYLKPKMDQMLVGLFLDSVGRARGDQSTLYQISGVPAHLMIG